ncbi:MAG: hypothetical protein M1608_14740, partial [Candidatus Omnitrophica bacterium]|nr:hypothetical protein [Candidatus Omnitrophota bacterium]
MIRGLNGRQRARPWPCLKRHWTVPWWFVVVGLVWLGGASLARGATTFTASLDRNSAVVGEGVTLSLSFEGDSPATAPTVPVVPGV